ncbi:chloride channel protein [Herbaspirillum sp. RV1423]|uniref:chloride channel protein n=1 Tax=Herbaspirillum sp. RV1423 TaxID=1443993 RepID=UPI000551058A|nr:chloride channel protein [Herbaspirillum sp. RV1423]
MDLSGIHHHAIGRARRLWIDYGILWSGAIAVGLVAVLYAQAIEYAFSAFRLLQHAHEWLPLLLTPAVSAMCVWITRRWFTGSEGSGIPQVIAALNGNTEERGTSLLSVRVLLGKLALSVVAIFGGLTIGREGPTVQIGAAIMFNLRRLYPSINVHMERRLILAGAAAGLAAAFNTPLAGVVFAIEELSRSFEQRASGVVITTIIFAGIVALGLNGNYTYFGTIQVIDETSGKLIVAVLTTAILTGCAGGIFCWLLLNTKRWIPSPLQTMRAEKPIWFAAFCGLVVAFIGVAAGGGTFGSGYAEARGLLGGTEQLSAFYPFLKMASMVGSYLPGMPGGMFAPSLSIGAGFGNLLHPLFGNTSLGMLIALAMVGYLAAVTQSPITAFVIVMEMVNGHALVISLMATALIASTISRFFSPPLYETLAERYLPRKAEHAPLEK